MSSETIITSDCPFFTVDASHNLIATIREGDRMDGKTVAVINCGNAMDNAEWFARMAVISETNTRMGTSESRQARKLKAIRKAMGYN